MTSSTGREAAHPINPIFLNRWSPRAFSGEAVSEQDLMTILEAARWAPSAVNFQPWRFIYGIKGSAEFDRLLSLLAPGNQRWAGKAGALVMIVSETLTGKPGDEERKPIRTHSFDAGAAWMALALQAEMLGYRVHAMGGVDYAAIPDALGLPDGVHIEAAVALGRMGHADDLADDLKAREKPSPRQPLSAIAFKGKYGG